jgi:uncharacterized protein (DUF58 family)
VRVAPMASVLLLLVGAFAQVPVAVVLGLILAVVELGHVLWVRRGIAGIDYVRHLATDRVAWGDEILLTIEVWNRTGLPLPWLRAEDDRTAGISVVGPPPDAIGRTRPTIRNLWSLAPSERVFRSIRLVADRRGVFAIGPVRLSASDLFARPAAFEERQRIDRVIVRPRVVAAPGLLRPDRWGELDRAKSGLSEDPSRFAGVRPWVPGDSLRRVHARASARLRRPMVKRFEPSRQREVLIALDVQTAGVASWEAALDPEAVEALYVVAGSLATSLERDGAAVGIIAGAQTSSMRRFTHVPVSDAPGQVGRILDLLARLSTFPSASFERLLATVHRTARSGTVVLAVTCRDPLAFHRSLRRLERAGCRVVVVASGPDAAANAQRARAAGFAARTAVLDGPWSSARALVVA